MYVTLTLHSRSPNVDLLARVRWIDRMRPPRTASACLSVAMRRSRRKIFRGTKDGLMRGGIHARILSNEHASTFARALGWGSVRVNAC